MNSKSIGTVCFLMIVALLFMGCTSKRQYPDLGSELGLPSPTPSEELGPSFEAWVFEGTSDTVDANDLSMGGHYLTTLIWNINTVSADVISGAKLSLAVIKGCAFDEVLIDPLPTVADGKLEFPAAVDATGNPGTNCRFVVSFLDSDANVLATKEIIVKLAGGVVVPPSPTPTPKPSATPKPTATPSPTPDPVDGLPPKYNLGAGQCQNPVTKPGESEVTDPDFWDTDGRIRYGKVVDVLNTYNGVPGTYAVVKFGSNFTCANSYFLCGDMRRAPTAGQKEQFRGIISAMVQRSDGAFVIKNECPYKWDIKIGEVEMIYHKACKVNSCPGW